MGDHGNYVHEKTNKDMNLVNIKWVNKKGNDVGIHMAE